MSREVLGRGGALFSPPRRQDDLAVKQEDVYVLERNGGNSETLRGVFAIRG